LRRTRGPTNAGPGCVLARRYEQLRVLDARVSPNVFAQILSARESFVNPFAITPRAIEFLVGEVLPINWRGLSLGPPPAPLQAGPCAVQV
jgi:hypothetical protein